MSAGGKYNEKRWFFSECSDRHIHDFVNSNQAKCLRQIDQPENIPINEGFNDVLMPSKDEQCKRVYGSTAYADPVSFTNFLATVFFSVVLTNCFKLVPWRITLTNVMHCAAVFPQKETGGGGMNGIQRTTPPVNTSGYWDKNYTIYIKREKTIQMSIKFRLCLL